MPQRVLFVEELSELLTEGLPDLWKLGQAYFSGALIGDVCYMFNVYMFFNQTATDLLCVIISYL